MSFNYSVFIHWGGTLHYVASDVNVSCNSLRVTTLTTRLTTVNSILLWWTVYAPLLNFKDQNVLHCRLLLASFKSRPSRRSRPQISYQRLGLGVGGWCILLMRCKPVKVSLLYWVAIWFSDVLYRIICRETVIFRVEVCVSECVHAGRQPVAHAV